MKRWPLKETSFWETAPFFRLLLPLMLGIMFYGNLSISLTIAIAIGSLAAIACISTGFIKHRNTVVHCLYLLSMQVTLIAAGWLLSFANDDIQRASYFSKQVGSHKYYTAVITQTPAEKPRTYKLPVEILNILDSNSIRPASGKGLVYVYKNKAPLGFSRGDTILLTDAWQPIKNSGNPYEFDYAQFAARNSMYYQQFVPNDKVQSLGRSTNISIIDRVHDACMAQLAQYLPEKKTLGLMQAMLIGDEVNLDNDTRQSYSETGIVHIIAISGSHITFFFVLISFLLGWIRNRKYHWLKYLLALPLIWFYVLMAGAAPSAVRAAVMFSLLSIGFALQRQPNSLNQLFATAFILLCMEPMWLYSLGFQLSFLAVLSLIIFYRPIYHWVNAPNKIMRILWSAVAASLAAELLVAPLVVYYFHLFPLWFIIANLAAYLFMGVILVAGILIIVFSALPAIAQLLGWLTILLVSWFNKLVIFFQTYNPRSFSFLQIDIIQLLLIYLIITTTAIFFLKKQRIWMGVAMTALLVLIGLLFINDRKASQQQRIVVYNINHKTYVELIEGKFHIPLTNDTLTNAEYNYCVKPAHIHWHAWRQKSYEYTPYHKLGDTTIAILEDQTTGTAKPINYLILTQPYKANAIHTIRNAYQPKKLILASRLSRKQVAIWVDSCKQAGIPVHAVSNDGAFILSGH